MDCPYCSDRLTRHIQQQQIYWFCRSCWQRFPDLTMERVDVSAEVRCGSTTVKWQKVHSGGAYRQLPERLVTVSEVTAQTA